MLLKKEKCTTYLTNDYILNQKIYIDIDTYMNIIMMILVSV